MQEFRVGIFMAQKGRLQTFVAERLERDLAQTCPSDYKISCQEFIAGSVREDRMREIMTEMTIDDVDLIVTIGFTATKIAAEVIRKKRRPIPTVFCAISDYIAEDLAPVLKSENSFMTGLYIKSVPEYMPIQMILRACPSAKKFLIPYRSGTKFGRITYEVQSIKEYFELRSVQVDDIDLETTTDPVVLREKIAAVDAVVIPESGTSTDDVQNIEKMCADLSVIFFGDGQQVLKKGGVYAFKRDFEFIGAKAAALTLEVLVEKKHPSQLPPETLKSSRKVQGISSEVVSKSGVFIADDVVASLEGEIENDDVPTFVIGMSCYAQTSFSFALQMITWQRLLKDKESCYIVHPYDGRRENKAFMEKHIQYLAKRNLHVMVYFDDQLAHLVWQEAMRKQLKLPAMVVIAMEDECVKKPWHNEARNADYRLSHIKIPQINPLIQLELLHEALPLLKKLTLVVNCNPEYAHDHLAARIMLLHEACAKRGIKLTVIGGPSFHEMHQIASSLTPDSADALMFYQDAFCARVGAHLVRRCDELGIPVCAGGMMWAQIAPLCYGVDMLKVREIARDFIDNFTNQANSSNNQDITLKTRDAYGFSFNEALCKKHRLRFSPTAQMLVDFQRYDMMHERNIAACIEAVGTDETGEPLMKNVPKPRDLTSEDIS